MPRGVMTTFAPPIDSLDYEIAQLAEINRATPAVESRYRMARATFIQAARDLNRHRERFDRRVELVERCGGKNTYDRPRDATLPTEDELNPID